MTASVIDTDLPGLRLVRRGKVRDTYDLGDRLLLVASDRISAYDVVLPTAIPGKGVILTQLSRFWFEQTKALVPNHLVFTSVDDFPSILMSQLGVLDGRSMIVRKADRIDIECVMRGYLAGSAWTEYGANVSVAGEMLPAGFVQSDRLLEPAFTPAIKNDSGHDENISRSRLRDVVGIDLAGRLEAASRSIYDFAAGYALRRGLIVADTKFEFGWIDGELCLIDELLTPDSSRFWDAERYEPGRDQPSFDKQYVRDWLGSSGWNREPPAPELPAEVVAGTLRRYHDAYERLTGEQLSIE